MTEAEKNNPAVTMPKGEEIQAASLKKSEELESKLQIIDAGSAGTPGSAPGAPDRSTPGARPPPSAETCTRTMRPARPRRVRAVIVSATRLGCRSRAVWTAHDVVLVGSTASAARTSRGKQSLFHTVPTL